MEKLDFGVTGVGFGAGIILALIVWAVKILVRRRKEKKSIEVFVRRMEGFIESLDNPIITLDDCVKYVMTRCWMTYECGQLFYKLPVSLQEAIKSLDDIGFDFDKWDHEDNVMWQSTTMRTVFWNGPFNDPAMASEYRVSLAKWKERIENPSFAICNFSVSVEDVCKHFCKLRDLRIERSGRILETIKKLA